MKVLKSAISVLLTVLCVIALCACTGSAAPENSDTPADAPSYVGSYTLYSIIIYDTEYLGEAVEEVLPGSKSGTLSLFADNTFTLDFSGTESSGEYTADGDSLILTEDGSDFPTVIEGGYLIMDITEYSGRDMQYIFVKEQSADA